jgi:hypothetical protein
MAWRSRTPLSERDAALERDTQELDAAATGFGEFQASTIDRLDVVEATLERLNARIDGIGRG